jgi:hypothetical protein
MLSDDEQKEDRATLSKWSNDLRQSFRTIATAAGVSDFDAKLLMNHAIPRRKRRVCHPGTSFSRIISVISGYLYGCRESLNDTELIRTADEVYVRLHGPKRWYRHDYSKNELAKWADRIKASGAKRAWIYFNNDNDAHAPKNATTLRRMLGRRSSTQSRKRPSWG